MAPKTFAIYADHKREEMVYINFEVKKKLEQKLQVKGAYIKLIEAFIRKLLFIKLLSFVKKCSSYIYLFFQSYAGFFYL